MTSEKRSRLSDSLSDSLSDNCVEGVDHPTPIKKQRQYLGSDLFNQMLPDELVIKIFSYFEYKDLLLGAALVSKRWENLSRDSDLWRSLDLSRLSCTFDLPKKTGKKLLLTVKKLLKRSKGIKHINLNECRFIKGSVMSKIVKQKKLRTLNLHDCQRLSPRRLGSIAKCRSLRYLNLRRVSLTDDTLGMIAESCTNLIDLDVSFCYNITTNGLLPVIQHCTQLRCLRIMHCQEVNDDFLMTLATEQSRIDSLDLSYCAFTEDGLQYLGKLPNLRRIELLEVENMCNNLVSIFSNLSFLVLEGIQDITTDGVSTIVRKNPNLEILNLSNCESIDNIALEIISKSPCRFTLTDLVIDNCSTTKIGIIHILQNCANLQSLRFSGIKKRTVNKWLIEYPHIELMWH